MKVKVLVGFKDRYIGKRYHPGEYIDVTQERLAEILEKGRLVELAEEDESMPEDEPEEETAVEGELEESESAAEAEPKVDESAAESEPEENEPSAEDKTKEHRTKARGKKKGK